MGGRTLMGAGVGNDDADRSTALVAVVVVAFEAASTIVGVLDRLPATVAGARPLVLVADDHSSDRTVELATAWAEGRDDLDVEIVRHPINAGYGGNQALCYRWALARGADIVVLLHGDGQYPPERIDDLVGPLLAGSAAAVFGSRMVWRGSARRGGMPLVRLIGNRSLTTLMNVLAPARLSEWFSGFRAYRTSALATVGLDDLPAGFDFDTAITLRLMAAGERIDEIAIPTHYGAEISRVPLLRTGLVTIVHGARALRRRRAGVSA